MTEVELNLIRMMLSEKEDNRLKYQIMMNDELKRQISEVYRKHKEAHFDKLKLLYAEEDIAKNQWREAYGLYHYGNHAPRREDRNDSSSGTGK